MTWRLRALIWGAAVTMLVVGYTFGAVLYGVAGVGGALVGVVVSGIVGWEGMGWLLRFMDGIGGDDGPS